MKNFMIVNDENNNFEFTLSEEEMATTLEAPQFNFFNGLMHHAPQTYLLIRDELLTSYLNGNMENGVQVFRAIRVWFEGKGYNFVEGEAITLSFQDNKIKKIVADCDKVSAWEMAVKEAALHFESNL